jgi:exodeoxyribonuclease VII small subunit
MTNTLNTKDMTFEQAMQELDTIVRRLEEGQAPLAEAITCYERGMELKKFCEEKLSEAKTRIEKIAVNGDGTISTEPITLS